MPIYFWTKEGAWLITKAARYVWPPIIAIGGAVGGFVAGIVTGKKIRLKIKALTRRKKVIK